MELVERFERVEREMGEIRQGMGDPVFLLERALWLLKTAREPEPESGTQLKRA